MADVEITGVRRKGEGSVPLPEFWDDVDDPELRERLRTIHRMGLHLFRRQKHVWENLMRGLRRDPDTKRWVHDPHLAQWVREFPLELEGRMAREHGSRVQRLERLARDTHERIQREQDRDKSEGGKCLRCGDFGLYEDSRLQDEYSELFETEIVVCRSKYVFCSCPMGAAKFKRWTGRNPKEASSRSRERSTGGKLEKAVEHPDDLLFPGGNDAED